MIFQIITKKKWFPALVLHLGDHRKEKQDEIFDICDNCDFKSKNRRSFQNHIDNLALLFVVKLSVTKCDKVLVVVC